MRDQSPKFLTPQEVSDRYGGKISVKTLNNWRNLGVGPAFTKLGGKVMYPQDRLVEWEHRNTVQSTSEYTRGNAA